MPKFLTLEVAGRQAAQFGSRSRKVFEGKGGSIGRSEDCDWVLSANGVSRVHAVIRLLNGMYFIEDRSTNGMLLNGAPLVKGDPATLKDGDRLTIDTFEVACRLGDAAEPPPFAAQVPPTTTVPAAAHGAVIDDPFDFIAPRGETPAPQQRVSFAADDLLSGPSAAASTNELDPLSFLGPLDSPSNINRGSAGGIPEGWNHSAATADHFHPPAASSPPVRPMPAAAILPENWDLTIGDFGQKSTLGSPPPPVRTPVEVPTAQAPAVQAPVAQARAVQAPAAQAPAVRAPAEKAAAPVKAPPSTLPGDVDQIFQIVVDGVMDMLRARMEIKNTFRLPVTVIQRSENNPLKFAPNAEDAMQRIFGPKNAGFLSGAAAFADAFDDIRFHQMAMMAGVRAAYEAMLMHFSPARLEHEFQGVKRSAFGGKGKYWEKFEEYVDALNKNPDDCFRRLFGDEFAKAYEEQLSRLKAARRAPQSMQR